MLFTLTESRDNDLRHVNVGNTSLIGEMKTLQRSKFVQLYRLLTPNQCHRDLLS